MKSEFHVFDSSGNLVVSDHGRTYSYRWHHVATGKNGIRSARFLDGRAYLATLSRWNADSRWIYSAMFQADPTVST